MKGRRTLEIVMVAFILAGCVLIADAFYVPAWSADVMTSLLLACMIPAYLAVSLIFMPSRNEQDRRRS